TILYSLAHIVVGLIGSVIIALILNEIRGKILPKLYQTTYILPNFLSMVVVSYIVFAFLGQYGLINKVILEGLGMQPIHFYFEPKYWPFILVFVQFWHGVGMGSVIYLAAMAGIDSSLYEAAIIDGANKKQQIWHITLPQIRSVMIVITLLSLGGIFRGNFGLHYQVPLDSGFLYDVTNIVDTYVYRALMNMNDIGMSAAAGLFQSVIGAIMIVAMNQIVRKIDPENSLW
ncbi:MAG: ABC transporter permease subunit, partial [bacterium]